ncbi:MAG TPA: AAA family ATPase [Halobacteriales archaeon]|nr:AAA family ATPase [Halobacteriales archaeon]
MTDPAATLTVRETDRDPGRRVAHLPAPVRRELGVLSGDRVVVAGESTVLATVWPSSGGGPDEGVALDRTTMAKAGVEAGDQVSVRPAAVQDADALVLVHPSPADVSDDDARRALADRPVAAGDRVAVADATATVESVRPGGSVRVTRRTTISVRPAESPEPTSGGRPAARSGAITYDDVGGLDEQLEQVREVLELPLVEPERFQALGIEPPTGVLLYGPPGTGKTLVVEAVAGSVDATVYHVSGPEIVSKYKGESEERLRETFEAARENAPAIVFFDELDAIAGKRDEGGDMERRVVAQLLSLLDGLAPRGNVVVVGATNRIDDVDPALRRPGRFDREIEIGVPDEAGRREILGIHADGVPIADDVDLDRLAARTHGFVGADLRALVTEAAMTALRRSRADGSEAAGERIEVTRADFEAAMASVDPSAMREFVAEIPATSFDDVGGLEEAKRRLREAVQWPLEYPRLFEATGTDPPAGILLYGPPGTGKTLLARALAHESGVNVIHVAGPELLDKYVGESEKAVREVFERARQTAPTIVFFDEIDAIAARRGRDDDVTERVVSQLLAELDGLSENPNLVVLAATNRREALDPALLRPGRLEVHVEVPKPDEAARRAILDVHARGKPLGDDVDLDRLAEKLSGATGATIEALLREATMLAIREHADRLGPAEANERADEIVVRRAHVEAAHRAMRKQPD